MGVNHVTTADGEELINLMSDTVDEYSLLEGATAHDASGEQIRGKAVYVNPNILDNWYFVNPINQRGETEYTQEQKYCVDRWVQRGGGTVTLTEEGLHSSATYSFAGVMQGVENGKKNLAGKTVTVSALLNSVSGGAVTLGITNGAGAGFAGVLIVENQTATDGLIFVTTTIPKTLENESLNVAVVAKEGSEAEFTVKAVKLELGETQTLARQDDEGNWVIIDPPPNRAVELLKCQRFLQYRTTGDVNPVDLRPTMRITPTVTQMQDSRWMYNAEL